MMDKLPACPFCGKPSEVYRKMARCSDVECHAHYIRVPIDEWNTRPIEDKLQQEIARLREALEFVLFNVDEDHPEDIGTVRAQVKIALREGDKEAL